MNAPRLEELIVSEVKRGAGTEIDPVRIVVQVHRKDGTPVAENDPYLADGLEKAAALVREADPHANGRKALRAAIGMDT